MLVRESISFQRGIDPKENLGIGKIYSIKKWLDEMKVKNYIINDDMTIDGNYNINLSNKNLKMFPEYIQFNKIEGFFICSSNELTSLRGCPKIVKGDFYCYYNRLTSLDGCPKIVDDEFVCWGNAVEFTIKDVTDRCKVKNRINVGQY
jgi:hypothetical protein